MSRNLQSPTVTAQSPPPLPAVSMDLASTSKDVLTQILLRLPAKTLIKFKSVCKKWLSLISSNYFCHQHTLRRPKLQQSLILQMQTMQFFYFNGIINSEKVMMIPYTLSVPHHEIVQDCNGLLLLEFNRLKNCDYVYNPTTKDLTRHLKHSYYVYNPTTRQARKITLTQSDKFPYVEAITLAFDPSKSPYYKLVCVRSTTYPTWAAHPDQIEPHAYRIEVYDSESHTWKLGLEPSMCPRIYNDRSFNEGVLWNNSIIWRNYDHHQDDNYCCFDIAKNEIKSLSAPQSPDRPLGYIYESNGHLYYLQLLREHQSVSVSVEVWEWGGDDHSQWLSKHRGVIHPRERGWIIALRFVATCSLLIYEFSPDEKSPPRMMAYNFLDNSYELLAGFTGQPVSTQRVIEGFQFGETLALV